MSVLRARVTPTANAAQRSCETKDSRGPRWVVDTGASRHICPRSAAESAIRPRCVSVETANGKVVAAGEATVRVPALGQVDALILDDAPRLLSVSMLVRDGYTLCWGPGMCCLSKPDRVAIKLEVVDGIPVLPAGRGSAGHGVGAGACQAKTRRGRRAGKRKRQKRNHQGKKDRDNQSGQQAGEEAGWLPAGPATNVAAVREGVDSQHRQQGHYPFRSDCSTCNEAALRSSPHQRRLPHTGIFATDDAPISTCGPAILAGATQQPSWTYGEPIRGNPQKECGRRYSGCWPALQSEATNRPSTHTGKWGLAR